VKVVTMAERIVAISVTGIEKRPVYFRGQPKLLGKGQPGVWDKQQRILFVSMAGDTVLATACWVHKFDFDT
jgi:hypothetical protein